jgi:hypothetical protein
LIDSLVAVLVTAHYTLGSEGSIMSREARVRLRFPECNALTATPSSIRKALLLFFYCGAGARYSV